MPETVSKADAVASNLRWYFTGRPCTKGHIAERSVSRNDCAECLKLRQKRWAKANAGQINQQSRAWYAENTDKAKATRAAWRVQNAEKDRADVAAYQKENRHKLRLSSKFWLACNASRMKEWRDKYRAENGEKLRALARDWCRRNPDRVNAQKTKRVAAKLRAMPAWAGSRKIQAVYAEASRRTRATGIQHHVDHIYPLRSAWCCGLHVENNLQILTAQQNQAKSNRKPTDASIMRECVYP